MEGSGDNRQNLAPVKKEPLRVRSFSSMRQHEQQQMAAAALRIPRGAGQLVPSLQPRDPRLKQHYVRPSVPFVSADGGSGSSSSSGNRSTIKFTPNVAVKQETAAGPTASASATAGISDFSVDALLLRSLHSYQPTGQGQDRLNRPKFAAAGKMQFSPVPAPQVQRVLPQASNSSGKQQQKKGPRSISLSDLTLDESQGHLFLPITIPFKLRGRRCMQDEQLKQETDYGTPVAFNNHQQQQLDELQGIDTAASTPNHLRRSESTAVQFKSGKDSLQAFSKQNQEDSAATLLLNGQFLTTGETSQEDSRPEFVHLCFPELLPPLDISAMQAQQAKSQQQAQEKAQEQQNKGSSSRCGPASATRRNCPTPLHALPSGRIGQLLIRRSGRVHLCLLTDIFRRRTAYAGAQTAGAAGEGAAEGNQGLEDCKNEDEDQKAEPRPTYTLRSDDICYDVLLGTEGSFAQEVGCLLSDTNEFIFLGRCHRKLIVTADVPRAVRALSSGM